MATHVGDSVECSSEVDNADSPDVDNSKDEWIDMTESFLHLCGKLDAGELVYDSLFSLGEAMSAVEFLDPRMDLNARSNWYKEGLFTVKEAFEDIVELESFASAQILGIVDELVSLIATWLGGHTIAQTVYTCIYLHDVSAVKHRPLGNMLSALTCCVELMRESIFRARVYIEDDHQCVTLGLNATSVENSVDQMVACLKEQEDCVQHSLKKTLKLSKEDGKTEENLDLELALQKALLARLRLCRLLLQLFHYLKAPQALKSIPFTVDTKFLAQLIEQSRLVLEEVGETLSLSASWDAKERLRYGFHDGINNLILPPSPKDVVKLSRREGVSYIKEVLEGLSEVAKVLSADSFKETQQTLYALCSPSQPPSVVVRSYLRNLLEYKLNSKLNDSTLLESYIRQDMRHFNNPPSLNPKSQLSSVEEAQSIVSKCLAACADPVQSSILLYCQHRSSHQQAIASCLDGMGELQLEVDKYDQLLDTIAKKTDPQRRHSTVFSTWLLRRILSLMIDFIQVAHLYKLYTITEVHQSIWYLDYLFGWLQTCLQNAEHLQQHEVSLTAKTGKQKAKRNKNPHRKELERDIAITNSKKFLCSGLMRSLEACAADNKVTLADNKSPALCFKHRFAPFSSITTPQPLCHQDYLRTLAMASYSGRQVNFYVQASKAFSTAKAVLEGLSSPTEEIKQLLSVTKLNLVICNIAASGGHKKFDKLLSLDYSVHTLFPVIRLM